MFLVSGTKRSGTSMWMQAFAAAGCNVFGERFPKNWGGGALRQANEDGFFESIFRDGVFFGTNPHPDTGEYVHADAMRGQIVKVFVPGVVRTELGYIEGVVANVRAWRDYEASVARLWALEDAQRAVEAPDVPVPMRIPGALEWWSENFALLRDQSLRGYPLLLQTYEQVLEDPATHVGRAFAMLRERGVSIEDAPIDDARIEAAIAAIKPSARTQVARHSDSVEPHIAQIFDDLHGTIERGRAVDGSLLRTLVETQRELMPQINDIKIERARRMVVAGGPPPPAFMLAASMS